MSISAQEAGQEIALRSLARRMAPQWRDRLLSLSDELRERMLKVAESNRVVEMVCQEMSLHFKSLFAAMMNDGIDGGTYSDRGRVGVAGGARVLDAVG
jgi:hypothetical protein